MAIDRYAWTTPKTTYRHDPACVLEAKAPDGARIKLLIEDDGSGGLRPDFLVELPDGTTACTDSAKDWPTVERYVPRQDWPEPMHTGQEGPGPQGRRPDAVVLEAIEQHKADLIACTTGDSSWGEDYLEECGLEATPEQREIIARASARIDAVLADARPEEREQALAGAVCAILGTRSPAQAGHACSEAYWAYEAAKKVNQGAAIAADLLGTPLTTIAEQARVSRPTAYRYLGRHPR